MNVAIFTFSSQKLSAGTQVTTLDRRSSLLSWNVFLVANMACLRSQMHSISALFLAWHVKIERPFEANDKFARPLAGVELEVHN
jgi:hypothetical protein